MFGKPKTDLSNAREVKNPFMLESFEDRSKAIGGKLERLQKDPKYQALDASGKVAVRARIYDLYVAPVFKEAKIAPPDKKEWLQSTVTSSSPFFNYSHDMVTGAVGGGLQLAQQGAKFFKNYMRVTYGLQDYFNGKTTDIWHDKAAADKAEKGIFKKLENSLQDGINQTNFFLNSRPRDNFLSHASSWSGEMVAQLPLYEALESTKISQTVTKGITGANSLTKTLAATKSGQFVANRLTNAIDGATQSYALTGDKKEIAPGAAGFALFGGTMEIGASVYKTFISRVMAMGGKPLAEELVDSAAAELNNEGHGIKDVPIATKKETYQATGPKEPQAAATKEQIGDVEIGSVGTHELGDITVAPKSVVGITAGHLIHNGEAYRYSTAEERQSVYNYLARKAERIRVENDSISAGLHDVAKGMLNTTANNIFKKDYSSLTPELQRTVLEQVNILHQQALQESVVHNPELVAQEVKQQLASEMQNKPMLAANVKELQEAGFDLTQIVKDENIKSNAIGTGVENTNGALSKLAGTKTKVVNDATRAAKDPYALPPAIAGSKFNYGQYKLDFADKRDAALYSIGQAKKNKSHEIFMGYLQKHFPGVTEPQLIAFSREVKEALKHITPDENGVIKVPSITKGEPGASTFIVDALREAKGPVKNIDYEPKEGASASLNIADVVGKRRESIAYYKNNNMRTAADGTLLGKRGMSIARENSEAFYDELRSNPGGAINFESPEHLMLFNWANRDKLPDPLRSRLLYELKKFKGNEGAKAADFSMRADHLMTHILKLAQDGRLVSEGVFKSTNTLGQPTKWQFELDNDLAVRELELVAKGIANFPGGKKALEAVVTGFQAKRLKNIKNPEAWLEFNKVIQNLVTGGF